MGCLKRKKKLIKVFASIVIYKHSYHDLKDTLDSLCGCEVIEKVILIDNDESDWANTFNHEKVIYIKSEGNFGFGYGHNLAIKRYASNSDLFLICNPDIRFEQSAFDQLVEFAAQREEGLFLPKIIFENGENQFGARLLPTPLNLFARRFSKQLASKLDGNYLLKSISLDKPIFVPYLSGCFMLFNSEKLLRLEGFDERFFMYMEDIDLSRRCAEKFGAIYYPLAKVIHKHEQGSYKNPALLKAHLKSAFDYFNKWGWVYDRGRSSLNKKCLNQF